jgi:hypothetical protein
MSDFETFTGIPKRKIPSTPEEAGLPSDEKVIAALRQQVERMRPAEDEPRFGIGGDGDFDPGNAVALVRLAEEAEAMRIANDVGAVGALAMAQG